MNVDVRYKAFVKSVETNQLRCLVVYEVRFTRKKFIIHRVFVSSSMYSV